MGWQDAPLVNNPPAASTTGGGWASAPLADPKALPAEKRNAMLQDYIRQPHVSASDALNYAAQLGLRVTSHLDDNLGKPQARVRDVTPTPPPPPPPDTSWGQDLKVAARAIPYGLADAGGFAEKVLGGPLGELIHLAGVPRASDQVAPLLEAIPFGRPQTRGQEYLSSAVRAGVAAAPGGATGGARAVGSALLSGISSGLSGEAVKQAGYGPAAQVTASIVGGLPGGLIAAAERAPAAAGQRLSEGEKVFQAAQRLNMEKTLLPADVGGVGTRMATAGSAMTLGGIPIAEQASKGVNALARARNVTAEAAGRVTDTTGAGQAAQTGAHNFISTSQARATRLYDAIPIHPEQPTVLANTKSRLAELNAGLTSNAELSALIADPRMKAFEDAIAGRAEQVPTGILGADGNPIMRTMQRGGQLSWQDLKAFRTYVGEKAGAPALQNDTPQKALKGLYGALSEDMKATARAEGPAAFRAFNRANQYWRGREDRIGSVLSAVLGKDMNMGANAAYGNVQRMTQTVGGDPIKLGRLVRSLTPDEGDSVRATIIQRMGQAKPGGQNAEGEIFSPAEFATQWNAMDPRSKAVLFNKPDMRQALDDIAQVASGMKMGQKFANTSKTGIAVNGVALVMKFFSTPVAGVGVAGGELAIGKVLSSPILTRALVRLSRSQTPNAIKAAISNVGNIATSARDPALRANATALQAALKAMNDNAPQAGRLAASPNAGPSDTNQQGQ